MADDPIENQAVRQLMLSFAYLAYCGQGITTPHPEAEILGLINAAMPKIKPIAAPNPTWKVVWGPVVFTIPGARYQDNLMFVVRNQVYPTQYAIAIRGTNFISYIDWLVEDLDILEMMPWPPTKNVGAIQPDPKISESTSIDLQVLLAMQDTRTNVQGIGLLDFLNSQTLQHPINLCVTGHSLGGCMAGTFALYLQENRGLWDKSKSSVVSCATFAAPTAGNEAFVLRSDQEFAGQKGRFPGWDGSLKTNCDAVRCSLDVGPLGWMTKSVRIPDGASFPPVLTIYGDNLNFINLGLGPSGLGFAIAVGLVCPKLVETAMLRNYQQVVAGAHPLVGTFKGASPGPSDDLEDYLSAFVKQAEYQHSLSYPVLLGVPELNDPKIIVTNYVRSKGAAL